MSEQNETASGKGGKGGDGKKGTPPPAGRTNGHAAEAEAKATQDDLGLDDDDIIGSTQDDLGLDDDIIGSTPSAADSADIITVVSADRRTGKYFSLNADGTVKKTGADAGKVRGRAHEVRISDAEGLVDHLKQVTSHDSTVIVPGLFAGSKDEPFNLVYEGELAELMGKKEGDAVLGGVHTINGKRYAARLKRGIAPCAWMLLDFDTPEGMPAEFAKLDIAGRLARLEKILPGISRCERVECRSSTARVVKPTGNPGRASHAWVRVSDPDKVEALRAHVRVEAALNGLAFLTPRHSTVTGETIGKGSRRTLVDTAVWVRGRIVFISQPVVSADMKRQGWKVVDADVTIINRGGGPLDLSGIEAPTAERLATYNVTTGETLSINRNGNSFAETLYGVLTLDTPIKSRQAPDVKTFGDAVKWLEGKGMDAKLRCEAPFRASDSEAAFIRIDGRGEPFLHDVGTGTTYRPPIPDPVWPPLTEEELAAIKAMGAGSSSAAPAALIVTGDAYRAQYRPLKYAIDGLLPQGTLTTITAPGNTGKTPFALMMAASKANGRLFCGRDCPKGHVLYCNGENPIDHRHRYIALVDNGGKFDESHLHIFTPEGSPRLMPGRIAAYATTLGIEFDLVLVDTKTAFSPGEEENSNDEERQYAQALRAMMLKLPGNPAVVVLAHPGKNPASAAECRPRGGSAFENETDGNWTLWKTDGNNLIAVAHTRLRVPHWDPFNIRLVETTTKSVVDDKGRPLRSIQAEYLPGAQAAATMARSGQAKDSIVDAMAAARIGLVARDIGEAAGLVLGGVGTDDKSIQSVRRLLKGMRDDKLVEDIHGKWVLTPKGKRYATSRRSNAT